MKIAICDDSIEFKEELICCITNKHVSQLEDNMQQSEKDFISCPKTKNYILVE